MPGYMPTASSHESSRQQNTRWYGLHPSVPVHCEPDRMICELLGWSGTAFALAAAAAAYSSSQHRGMFSVVGF